MPMEINNLREAFLAQIQMLYDAENQLMKALPMMADSVEDSDIKKGFKMHLEETKDHVGRLEEVFEMLDEDPSNLSGAGIRGIIEDGEMIMNIDTESHIKDVMIAGAARFAEHYEMAGYLSAITQAQMLNMPDAVELLSQTMLEEESADKSLAEGMKKILRDM